VTALVETIDLAGEAGKVHISALTHFEIAIDGKPEPVMALADSGLQIRVICRESISKLNLNASMLGQIKIQGICGIDRHLTCNPLLHMEA